MVTYLATEQASNINGRVFRAYGGLFTLFSNPEMMKHIYKQGRWTLDELMQLMPMTLAKDLVNPAPPATPESSKKV